MTLSESYEKDFHTQGVDELAGSPEVKEIIENSEIQEKFSKYNLLAYEKQLSYKYQVDDLKLFGFKDKTISKKNIDTIMGEEFYKKCLDLGVLDAVYILYNTLKSSDIMTEIEVYLDSIKNKLDKNDKKRNSDLFSLFVISTKVLDKDISFSDVKKAYETSFSKNMESEINDTLNKRKVSITKELNDYKKTIHDSDAHLRLNSSETSAIRNNFYLRFQLLDRIDETISEYIKNLHELVEKRGELLKELETNRRYLSDAVDIKNKIDEIDKKIQNERIMEAKFEETRDQINTTSFPSIDTALSNLDNIENFLAGYRLRHGNYDLNKNLIDLMKIASKKKVDKNIDENENNNVTMNIDAETKKLRQTIEDNKNSRMATLINNLYRDYFDMYMVQECIDFIDDTETEGKNIDVDDEQLQKFNKYFVARGFSGFEMTKQNIGTYEDNLDEQILLIKNEIAYDKEILNNANKEDNLLSLDFDPTKEKLYFSSIDTMIKASDSYNLCVRNLAIINKELDVSSSGFKKEISILSSAISSDLSNNSKKKIVYDYDVLDEQDISSGLNYDVNGIVAIDKNVKLFDNAISGQGDHSEKVAKKYFEKIAPNLRNYKIIESEDKTEEENQIIKDKERQKKQGNYFVVSLGFEDLDSDNTWSNLYSILYDLESKGITPVVCGLYPANGEGQKDYGYKNDQIRKGCEALKLYMNEKGKKLVYVDYRDFVSKQDQDFKNKFYKGKGTELSDRGNTVYYGYLQENIQLSRQSLIN